MSTEFQRALEAALNTYHPGWEVRHRSAWPYDDEAWRRNRRLGVWSDTLKRWVRGEHFPRVKKFEELLANSAFPADTRTDLLRLFHQARRTTPLSSPTLTALGQRPLPLHQAYVGRASAIDQLIGLLNDSTTRLITIVGRAGIGKTALTCHVLSQIEDGAHLQPAAIFYLSTHTGGISLEQIFRHAIELDPSLHDVWAAPIPTPRKIAALLDAWQDGLYLIFLDNCEDLLDPDGVMLDADMAAFVEACLQGGTGGRLLITSRTEVALPRELRQWQQLVPLDEGLALDEGVALLRAFDPNGTCGLRDAPTADLEGAVRQLHGVPRALEVLAGMLEDERLARLDTLLARYSHMRDVREMVADSLKRFDAAAQAVMAALAVLRRPVPIAAVAALCDPSLDVEAMLGRLARSRMVTVDRQQGVVALHPIDVDLVYSQLANAPMLEAQAAAYYAHHAPAAAQDLDTMQPQLLAFEHWLRAGDPNTAYAQVGEAGFAALLRWGQGQRVATLRRQLVGNLDDPVAEALNLYGLAMAFQAVGQFQEAIGCYGRVLVLPDAEPSVVVRCWVGIGDIYRSLENYGPAITHYRRALGVNRDIDALVGLAGIYTEINDIAASRHYSQEALKHAADSPSLQAKCHLMAGVIERGQGNPNGFFEHIEMALALTRYQQDRVIEAAALSLRGVVRGENSDHPGARLDIEAALGLCAEHGDLHGRCLQLGRLGWLHLEMGDLPSAQAYCEEAVKLAGRIGARLAERCNLLYLALGDVLVGADLTPAPAPIGLERGADAHAQRDADAVRTPALASSPPHQRRAAGRIARACQRIAVVEQLTAGVEHWYRCRLRLAHAHLLVGDYAKAEAICVATLPYTVPLLVPYGLVIYGASLHQQGRAAERTLRQAVHAAEMAIEMAPQAHTAWYARAVALSGLDDGAWAAAGAVCEAAGVQALWKGLRALVG